VAAALVLAGLKSRRALAIASTGLLVVVVLLLVTLPTERTLARWDPETGTALFRVEIWRSALHMIADHPLFGLGMDNFLYAYQGGYMEPAAWREPNISHPHNWILDFWIQLGLPGLVVALALICWSIVTAVRMIRLSDPTSRTIGAAALGVTVVFLTHGSVDNSYFLVDSATIWWIIVALLLIGNADDARPKQSPEPLADPSRDDLATMQEPGHRSGQGSA
jgi:O-antigen ligase